MRSSRFTGIRSVGILKEADGAVNVGEVARRPGCCTFWTRAPGRGWPWRSMRAWESTVGCACSSALVPEGNACSKRHQPPSGQREPGPEAGLPVRGACSGGGPHHDVSGASPRPVSRTGHPPFHDSLPRPMTPEPVLSPASELCTSCGLCCDGTVFSVARMEDGDVPPPGFAEGARWRETPEEPAFLLPCHAFVGQCGIYGNRPRVCQSYRCRVLRRAETGKHTWERAQELVRLGKERRDALREAIGRATGSSHVGASLPAEMERVMALRQEAESDTQFRHRMGEVLVAHAALRHLMEGQFLRRKPRESRANHPSAGGPRTPLPMTTEPDPDGASTPPSR